MTTTTKPRVNALGNIIEDEVEEPEASPRDQSAIANACFRWGVDPDRLAKFRSEVTGETGKIARSRPLLEREVAPLLERIERYGRFKEEQRQSSLSSTGH